MRAVVVGGGMAGLFTASELVEAGVDDIVVLDRDEQAGGVARTIRRDGYELEPGAGTLLLPNPHLSPVLDHLGIDLVPAIDAGIRYVYTRGRLVALPSSPKALVAPVVPIHAKLRAAAEPFIRVRKTSPDESLHDFLCRRLGTGLGTTVAWLAASGVFAGDPRHLSANAAFPAIRALEADAGSITRGAIRRLRARAPGATRPTAHVPVGGMSAIAARAVERLGDRYRPGVIVESVRPAADGWRVAGSEDHTADHVILAVRPSDAAGMLEKDIADNLGRAVSAPVVVVGLGAEARRLPLPHGFGALTGPDAATATLGILFESSYAPHRAPVGHSFAKVIAGGSTRPDVVDWTDDQIIDTIVSEASRILAIDVDPTFVEIVRHHAGIPQYQTGHLEWVAELQKLARPGLHLTGWGYRGVGVAHVAADATRVARHVVDSQQH
jgi:protoporphyrinogen/coproporphyrinogen III oxidase